MLVTIAVKFFLFVSPSVRSTRLADILSWIWCARIPSSGVQALAQDAKNDVFFNSMSLAFPVSFFRVSYALSLTIW